MCSQRALTKGIKKGDRKRNIHPATNKHTDIKMVSKTFFFVILFLVYYNIKAEERGMILIVVVFM
ncbi:MAG: hypothetical protein C0399_01990 [Syntrophus sp. (in: bacteria)]|nr:hypothetical protein [Syntrophus sp. (in: bacteria)]